MFLIKREGGGGGGERLIPKLEDSTRSFNELRVEKESVDIKVKTLTSDLEKSYTQLFFFFERI